MCRNLIGHTPQFAHFSKWSIFAIQKKALISLCFNQLYTFTPLQNRVFPKNFPSVQKYRSILFLVYIYQV